MFDVKVYTGPTLAEGAKLAVRHRLYVKNWCLRGELKWLADPDSESDKGDNEVAIGMLDGLPIAVVMRRGSNAQAFCRKRLRKKGYASKCFQALSKVPTRADEGTEGSHIFWRKNGIPVAPWRY